MCQQKLKSRGLRKKAIVVIGTCLMSTGMSLLAGTLSPKGDLAPLEIKDHNVDVVINNGFAKVEVSQRFFNQHDQTTEGIYSFPVPKSASMSEVSVNIGEKIINGEVVSKAQADKIYKEEKSKGNDVAKAEKNKYQDFKFFIANIPAKQEVKVDFTYYQPLKIDTNMGCFHYPMEKGGTDEVEENFWANNSKVNGKITINIKLKSAAPLSGIRAPSLQPASKDLKLDLGYANLKYEIENGSLDKDFIFYYRLKDNLPGSVEVIPYKEKGKEGTFMMVVSPGEDLKPLINGHDYLFILDKSGSMSGKIRTLNKAVSKSISKLNSKDRFRIYTFDDNCNELTSNWAQATQENIKKYSAKVNNIRSGGGTNMYNALKAPLKSLDADRVTSVILLTDAVTNQGIVSPKSFVSLLKQYDIRLFGFLMGNSSNWPLMEIICETSGGYYDTISNSDDITGKILQAKGKVAFECMHDAKLKIKGVKTYDTTNMAFKKVYRGEQLVIFGRYAKGGKAKFEFTTRVSGEDKAYEFEFDFPEENLENPELERMWAMSQVEMYNNLVSSGIVKEKEFKNVAKDIGLKYQIVTDETSMLVLSDQDFKRHGIKRNNQKRILKEERAQVQKNKNLRKRIINTNKKQSSPVFNLNKYVAKPLKNFKRSRPSIGGGGAIDPKFVLMLTFGLGIALLARKRKC